jgi:hypothetical protein
MRAFEGQRAQAFAVGGQAPAFRENNLDTAAIRGPGALMVDEPTRNSSGKPHGRRR